MVSINIIDNVAAKLAGKVNVLIVDDDAGFCKSLAFLLLLGA
jgi:hypothetical protein